MFCSCNVTNPSVHRSSQFNGSRCGLNQCFNVRSTLASLNDAVVQLGTSQTVPTYNDTINTANKNKLRIHKITTFNPLISEPTSMKFGREERSALPCEISPLLVQRVALLGENQPLGKNNIDRAAPHAVLPVVTSKRLKTPIKKLGTQEIL